MRGRFCVPFISMHGMVKILFSWATEKKLLSHNAHASCMLVIRKACWYRQKGTGGINDPLNDETLIVSQLSSWFSFGALIDTGMCVSSIAPTTLGKVDVSLKPHIFFPHLSRRGWKFNELVFKLKECLNKVLAYFNSRRLGNSKHKTTRTITIPSS